MGLIQQIFFSLRKNYLFFHSISQNVKIMYMMWIIRSRIDFSFRSLCLAGSHINLFIDIIIRLLKLHKQELSVC